MRRSNLIKLILFASLCFLPRAAEAETFSFQNQTWEIPVEFTSSAELTPLRQDRSLFYTAQHVIFGEKFENPKPLLEHQTIAELENLVNKINQAPEEARLVLAENRAREFNPGRTGQAVDLYAMLQSIYNRQSQAPLPVVISQPVTKLSDTNSLGINELVAIGESDFTGSPYNRTVNIQVGADKYDGLILKPGEEFSFNKFLGDVDAANGFLPELVIKRSGVVPEFGGGLCQVSSTAFRAAMNAGLPITERRNHSFAVQYYAPQGTDATIYPGVTDLRFRNDLSSSLLIRTRIEGKKLFFEFYGTKDSREIAFDGPYQYDKKSDGSMKATWTRHVIVNGQTQTQTFNSTYQPPALFQRQTEAATPNPQAEESTAETDTGTETPPESSEEPLT